LIVRFIDIGGIVDRH